MKALEDFSDDEILDGIEELKAWYNDKIATIETALAFTDGDLAQTWANSDIAKIEEMRDHHVGLITEEARKRGLIK